MGPDLAMMQNVEILVSFLMSHWGQNLNSPELL